MIKFRDLGTYCKLNPKILFIEKFVLNTNYISYEYTSNSIRICKQFLRISKNQRPKNMLDQIFGSLVFDNSQKLFTYSYRI